MVCKHGSANHSFATITTYFNTHWVVLFFFAAIPKTNLRGKTDVVSYMLCKWSGQAMKSPGIFGIAFGFLNSFDRSLTGWTVDIDIFLVILVELSTEGGSQLFAKCTICWGGEQGTVFEDIQEGNWCDLAQRLDNSWQYEKVPVGDYLQPLAPFTMPFFTEACFDIIMEKCLLFHMAVALGSEFWMAFLCILSVSIVEIFSFCVGSTVWVRKWLLKHIFGSGKASFTDRLANVWFCALRWFGMDPTHLQKQFFNCAHV